MLIFFFVSVASFVARDVRADAGLFHLGRNVNDSLFWLVWFEVLAVLGSMSPTARRQSGESGGQPQLGVRTRLFATVWLALLAGVFRDSASPVVWLAWFGGLGLLLTMEARWGVLRDSSTLLEHPSTGDERLSRGRELVAAVTLAFFPMLFMPTPLGT